MTNDKIFAMPFAKVYDLLLNKAMRKGRTREEVDAVTTWLTGYTPQALAALPGDLTYGDFFRHAPAPSPHRFAITGTVCGVRVEQVEDPLMREIRYLDKLVDELAKGRSLEKILSRRVAQEGK